MRIVNLSVLCRSFPAPTRHNVWVILMAANQCQFALNLIIETNIDVSINRRSPAFCKIPSLTEIPDAQNQVSPSTCLCILIWAYQTNASLPPFRSIGFFFGLTNILPEKILAATYVCILLLIVLLILHN